MRNQKLIISLSNSDLELYSLILSFYLDTVILSFDHIDGIFNVIKYHHG
jgi:hypothetical protein